MRRAGATAASAAEAPVAVNVATGPPAVASFRSLCQVMREDFPQLLEGAVGIVIASLPSLPRCVSAAGAHGEHQRSG